MMRDFRLALHNALKTLEDCEAYYQPPENLKITYPCFVYRRIPGERLKADNKLYHYSRCWEVIFITKDPESTIREDILDLFPMCRHLQDYVSDNLYHHVFNLYY